MSRIAPVLAVILAWLLWILSWFRRGRPHPDILRSSRVRLDTGAIASSAGAGIPFELQLGRERVVIAVTPANPWEAGVRAVAIDGDRPSDVEVGETVQFAGQVEGSEASEVRLTITPEHVSGYVLKGRDWWFIEPLRKFDATATPADHLVYRTKDLHFRREFGQDALPVKERGEGGVDPPHRVNPIVGIALVADREYEAQANVTSLAWHQQQASLINQVNGIFRARVGSEFRVRWFILDRRTTSLNTTNAEDLLDQIENPIQLVIGNIRDLAVRQSSGVEVAHLTTGKNLDGNTLGIAWRPGVYGLSQNQLFWLGGGGGLFGGGPNLAYQNMMVATHELGHNFNGIHEQADKWCVAHFLWCWDYERSIMWPTFYDDNQSVFSDGSRDSGHNNRQRIIDNFATGRNRSF